MGKNSKRPGSSARAPGKRPRRTPNRFDDDGNNSTESTDEQASAVGKNPGDHMATGNSNTAVNGSQDLTDGGNNTGNVAGSREVSSVNEHDLPIEWVTGEEFGSSPVPVASVFDGIGDHVPLKLKEKIWAGEFFSLGLMLKSARDLAKEMDQAGGEIVMKGGKLVVQKHLEAKPIYNIHVWTSAFMVYMSVVLEKHPAKAQELLKYMRDIRLAANRSGSSWFKYDEQYRLKKVKYPTSSWGLIDSELWLLYVTSQRLDVQHKAITDTNTLSQGTFSASNNYTGLDGTGTRKLGDNFRSQGSECWGYNKGHCAFGPKCRYRHACSTCGGPHTQLQCKRKSKGTNQ